MKHLIPTSCLPFSLLHAALCPFGKAVSSAEDGRPGCGSNPVKTILVGSQSSCYSTPPVRPLRLVYLVSSHHPSPSCSHRGAKVLQLVQWHHQLGLIVSAIAAVSGTVQPLTFSCRCYLTSLSLPPPLSKSSPL